LIFVLAEPNTHTSKDIEFKIKIDYEESNGRFVKGKVMK